MDKKSLKPRIRFKGFTEAWEQRKLGEAGKARSGVGFPDTEQGGKIGVPFFKVSDMNSDGNENEMTVANNYVTVEQIAAHRWSPIEELPALFFAKVGAAVMLNRKRLCRFPFLLDNNTMAYSLSSTEWDADFAKALFETIDLTSLVQVGALPSYNSGDVEAMEISMPSLSEQGQIGELFKQLDNLITLHQRKHEKLTQIKKSLLEKMFPADGEKTPKIRFKGFTEAWEQRKLSDLVNVYDGVHQTPNYQSSGIMFLSVEDIRTLESNKFISESDFYRDYKIYPQKGDILMTRIGDVGTPNVVKNDNLKAFYVSLALLKPKTIDSNFLNNNIQSESFKKELKQRTLVTAIPQKINKDQIGLINVIYPCEIKEQVKIGLVFEKLGNLITLHQRKCKKLKNIKKSLLEKMFV
ncbi:MAG: restriction endonuclease subunit S [Candidatus Enterosoma sp.]|nr:restriction endonuclease subunit S [Candidatus Enterosoma sp.]